MGVWFLVGDFKRKKTDFGDELLPSASFGTLAGHSSQGSQGNEETLGSPAGRTPDVELGGFSRFSLNKLGQKPGKPLFS